MISSELIKGSLKSIVLKLLTEYEQMYGYEITQKVEEITKSRIKLNYGALYPVLHKLELEGALVTRSEVVNNRTRVYYKLTPHGRNKAGEKVRELHEFIDSLKAILEPAISKNVTLC